jgi:hypothetical protein
MQSKTTLAYAAGILDGEGYFSIIWYKPQDRYSGVVGVMNTNHDLLIWLQESFGGSIYNRTHQPSHKEHWKPRYEWKVGNTTLDRMLPPIMPYLKIKKPHAKVMIAFRQTLTSGRRPLDQSVLAKRRNLHSELLALNHRTYVNLGSGLSVLDFP